MPRVLPEMKGEIMNKPGLSEKIRRASSADEIESLLAEGAKYADASLTTRTRWTRCAERRKRELSAPKKEGKPKEEKK